MLEGILGFYKTFGLDLCLHLFEITFKNRAGNAYVRQILQPVDASEALCKRGDVRVQRLVYIPSVAMETRHSCPDAFLSAEQMLKPFPDMPCVSQILGGLSLRLGIPGERLSIPPGSG